MMRRPSIGFSSYVEAIFVIGINGSLNWFKGKANVCIQLIQKRSTESITQKGIVEVANVTPGGNVTRATFGEKAMDMGIPFQVTTKSVKNENKARGKPFLFV